MDTNTRQSHAEAARLGESVQRNDTARNTSIGGYAMPERFNGMDLPESWNTERAFARLMLQTNPAAAALKKALDELTTPEARTMKLKLGITGPEQE